MAVERIELEVVLQGEQKIKKLEADIAKTATAARELRLTNNALLQDEITKNKKITAEERQQIRLRRLEAELAGLEKQETAAILVTERKQTAEAKKQLALQTKMDRLKQRELDKAARVAKLARDQAKASRQRGQQGGLIGAGFPLLFGGGPGSVIGGGLGGLLGESILGKGGGFAGSIALSAVGAQIDAMVGKTITLGKALQSTTEATEYLTENSLWADEQTRILSDRLKELGDVEEASALSAQQFARILGKDAYDALDRAGKEADKLATDVGILWTAFMGLASYLVGPLLEAINTVTGGIAKGIQIDNMTKTLEDSGFGDKVAEAVAAATTSTPSETGKLIGEAISGPGTTYRPDVNQDKLYKELLKAMKATGATGGITVPVTQQDMLNYQLKDKTSGGEKTNRDAENLLRAQEILAIEQKRLTLMQTMEPMIGRAAQARDRAYALAKADFDTQVAKSKIEAQDIPPLEKKIKLKTEDVKLAQKLLVLKRKNDERLMKEAETLEQIKAYGELDYAIATAKTKELEKQLKLKKKLLQIENSGGTDEQKKAAKDAAKKMDGITDLDKYIAQLNKELTDTDAMIIQLSETIITEFSGAMTSAITGLITGTKTAQEAFSEMFANIGKAFIDMATKMIAKALILKALGVLKGAFGGGDSGGGVVESLSGGTKGNLASITPFADGGYVTGPTNALIGEGGDSEYVIPSQKMGEAMERYSGGMRGDAVIPGSGDGGGMGSSGADLSTAINISGGVLNFNDESYIKQDQIPAIIDQAGKSGETRTLRKLMQSPTTRRRIGMS